MKTLNPNLQAQASADGQAPILLAEISDWGGDTIRLANTDSDVTLDGGITYYDARPFSVSGAMGAVEGTAVQSGTITIANQDLAFSILCAANDPRGANFKLFRVFLDNLSVSQDPFVDYAKIVSYSVTESTVKMNFAGMGDLFKISIPRRWHNRTCPWVFKGPECGYPDDPNDPELAKFCAKSLDHQQNGPHEYTDAACNALGNYPNFGGFLFVFPGRK